MNTIIPHERNYSFIPLQLQLFQRVRSFAYKHTLYIPVGRFGGARRRAALGTRERRDTVVVHPAWGRGNMGSSDIIDISRGGGGTC